MKKCCVLGANGFIGKHIVGFLQHQCGMDVLCYDVVEQAELPNYQCVDLTNRQAVENIDLDVDYIFYVMDKLFIYYALIHHIKEG